MKNYKFYAVVDDKGVVGISNEKYRTLKAIFTDLSCAERVLERNKNMPLRIEVVEIIKPL
jgi:hypothetical protein|nr:MAG TPA: hypothetical protein [Caudoviricetes sp.]